MHSIYKSEFIYNYLMYSFFFVKRQFRIQILDVRLKHFCFKLVCTFNIYNYSLNLGFETFALFYTIKTINLFFFKKKKIFVCYSNIFLL